METTLIFVIWNEADNSGGEYKEYDKIIEDRIIKCFDSLVGMCTADRISINEIKMNCSTILSAGYAANIFGLNGIALTFKSA